jgi:pyruvate dehydrogenase E1 component beta subunit
VTIVSYSKMVQISLEAAKELEKQGISAEVVDLRTLRPLDIAPVLESFQKTNHCVVVEEGWSLYGVGAEIAARIQEEAFDWMDAPVKRVAQEDVPLPYSRDLEQSALPDAQKVIKAVKETLGKS